MRRSFVVALISLLAACVTVPERLVEQRWQAHVESLEGFTDWRVNARIAVTTADDGGNVRMIWRQRANAFDVRFSAAFGQGATQITQTGNTAVLVDSAGEITRGTNAEQLLFERLGWRVPIAQLGDWLVGNAGDAEDYTLRSDGLLASARLDGWTVEFQRYNTADYPVLPTKISLYREKIRVRVGVDGWSHLSRPTNSKRVLVPGE